MPKISAVILAVLICVFAGILIGKLKENYDPEIFSENYISVDEVKQELIFTVYSQEEWDEWFEGGKKDYLTGAVLDELLKRLGVSEQIDFSEKRKNAAVSWISRLQYQAVRSDLPHPLSFWQYLMLIFHIYCQHTQLLSQNHFFYF